MSFQPLFKGKTKTQESVDVRRCRLVPVLRAETNTLKIVEMRRCRLVPVLRAETNTLKIVKMCVCRLVPVLTYNVNNDATENVKSVHFTPVFRGEMTCSNRVCDCVCSSRALFKGRNANCTQRGAPCLLHGGRFSPFLRAETHIAGRI